ncbi:Parvovirus coat protein VP1-like protein [Bacillus mesophilum]|uniref:Parvovirus coat protein VP1-like protein n=1 Tax=Bacillus mesophilum TaxID=1071718 RepID=A0A7V7RJ22_9BACI|nr:Parvovirus coat protein VP1-like protein [Bacillus mesophilum]KAB2330638.1 Parvovirus coat protein VP1-like protein [Bacillus mesophilum]
MRIQNRRRTRGPGFCLSGGYRYCGPGCSGPGEPINYVDYCCKKHDECLSEYGDSCRCDQVLIQCVESKLNNCTDEGKKARLISRFMKFRMSMRCGRWVE